MTRDSIDRHVEIWSKELDWLDPVNEAIFARLAIIARHAAQARRNTLDADGLRYWQFKVLLQLRRTGPPYEASPSHLADSLGLTRGALSARLAPIEEAGFITRTHEIADRRRVRVRLTEAGSAAFEQQVSREERGEAALLAPLTAADRQTLADLLRKVVAEIEGVTDADQAPRDSPDPAESPKRHARSAAKLVDHRKRK
jgi:DNA-binding MarR family transcriptional regulator